MFGRAFLSGFIAIVILGAAACSPSTDSTTTTSMAPLAKLKVVATHSVLADFARILGGDYVDVYTVVKPGLSPHHYLPTTDDNEAIAEATVILRNGLGLDSWLESSLAETGAKGVVIDTSAEITPRPSPYSVDLTPDPHIWHSPQNAKLMADAVARSFIHADSAHEAAYTINQRAYFAQLDGMSQDIQRVLEGLENRRVVTAHASILYYLAEFGFEFTGSVVPSVDVQAEATETHIAELVAAIKARGVRAVFGEQTVAPAGTDIVARIAGVKAVVGDEALYVDGLSANGGQADSYIRMERFNTSVIAKYLAG